MKTEQELKQRMLDSTREHDDLVGGRKFKDLEDFEQEQATELWHEVSVLHWALEGY